MEEGDEGELSLGGRCRQEVLEPPVVDLKLDEKSPKKECGGCGLVHCGLRKKRE